MIKFKKDNLIVLGLSFDLYCVLVGGANCLILKKKKREAKNGIKY